MTPKRILVVIFAAVVALVMVVWLLNAVLMPWYTRAGNRVDLPDVQNTHLNEALSILNKLKLKPVVTGRRFDMAPAGTVIYQSPPPGTPVKTRRRIHLTVSRGEAPIQLPELIGRSFRQARLLISQAGVEPGHIIWSSQFDSLAPVGVVLGQIPKAGQSLSRADTLTMILSCGFPRDSLAVPDLIRLTEAQARDQLLLSGLGKPEIETVYYEGIAADQVIEQNPASGVNLPFGTPVQLVITAAEEPNPTESDNEEVD